MAQNYAPQSYDGQMRIDNNNQDRLNYMPNSYDKPMFSDNATEAPYVVADAMVSRQSHHKNEGDPVQEYQQAQVLYNRVMDSVQRDHLHKNTAYCMNCGVSQTTRTRYLAQVYNISPAYVDGVIAYLDDKNVSVEEVKELAKTACMMGKSEKYRPKESGHHFLTGREAGKPLVCPYGNPERQT